MKQFIIVVIVFFYGPFIYAQAPSISPSLPNILPPSPDAYNFAKYGNLPIGISSGTAQFSLPIYTVQSGNLKLPISLNYSSNGVKVDEMATRVGINWNLNAGGVITRVVLDKADDETFAPPTFYHGPINWGVDRIDSIQGRRHFYFNPEKWTFYNYIKAASQTNPPDYQPDEYTYNVDGYSGKFIRRENGELTQFKPNGVKIEKNNNGFILTAPNGNRYFFYVSEIAHNYTNDINLSLESVTSDVPTAWYLTKIISITNDTITLNYNSSSVSYINGISQNYNTGPAEPLVNTTPYSYNCCVPDDFMCSNSSGNGLSTSLLLSDNNIKLLSSIDFNLGKVDFIYSNREDVIGEKKLDEIRINRKDNSSLIKSFSIDHQYSEAPQSAYDPKVLGVNIANSIPQLRKRLFLKSVNELSNDLSVSQKYQFEYTDINKLPSRMSFSQDHHGFFNGYVNDLFIPNDTWFDIHLGNNNYGGDRRYNFKYAGYGMLKKIIYPTGGFSKFEYEPHKTTYDYAYTYFSDSTIAEIDSSTTMYQTVLSDTFHHNGSRELRIRYYCDWATAPVNLMSSNGGFTDFLEDYHFVVTIKDAVTGDSVFSKTMEPYINYIDGYFTMYKLPPGIYKIELKANRPRMKARVSVIKSWRIVDKSDTAGIAGIRVKAVSDYSITNEPVNKREFVYGDWTTAISSSGTGLIITGNGSSEVSLTRTYGGGFNSIHSSSIFNTFQSSNNTVVYGKVIELNTSTTSRNNGGKEYEFFYSGQNVAVPITYHWDCVGSLTNDTSQTIPTYGNVWNPVPIVPPNAPLINNDFFAGLQKSVKTFTYQTKFGTRNILDESTNFYSLDTPSIIIDTFTVSKNDIKRNGQGTMIPAWIYLNDYIIYRYWRYFAFVKLDSTVTKSYSNTVMKVKNSFSYSMLNFLPNQTISTSSKGKVSSSFTRYVSDVENSNADYLDVYLPLYSANRISSPYEEYTYRDGLNIRTRKMRYKNFTDCGLILPYEVMSQQLNNNYTVDLTFEKYDNKGNLLQYKGRDGVTNSIIWGYNKSYPVAKIVGMGYDDAINLSGLSLTTINDLSLNYNAVRNELNKLRTNLIGKVFVNTLTYSPLIGVTSETDANGNTKFYEYDGFNRLKLIRDKNNNILKKICYNFQGQQTECSETITLPPTTVPLCEDCIGVDKKCIGNVCVTAKVKCFQSDLISPGLWNNTFRYEWPDLSYSQNITEVQNHPCLDTTVN